MSFLQMNWRYCIRELLNWKPKREELLKWRRNQRRCRILLVYQMWNLRLIMCGVSHLINLVRLIKFSSFLPWIIRKFGLIPVTGQLREAPKNFFEEPTPDDPPKVAPSKPEKAFDSTQHDSDSDWEDLEGWLPNDIDALTIAHCCFHLFCYTSICWTKFSSVSAIKLPPEKSQ